MKQTRRRWWTRLVTVLAVLTVVAATISVLFKIAVDAVPAYRTELESFVAKSVGHPARIGAMALTWRHLLPTLELRDVALLDQASGAPLLQAGRLSLGISPLRLLGGDVTPSRIEASGIALDADIDAHGHWSLRGFDASAGADDNGSLLKDLARFRSIRVLESQLLLHDARLANDGAIPVLAFRLRSASIEHTGEHYALAAALEPPAALARRASLRATLDGDPANRPSWQGSWHLDVQQITGWPWLAEVLEPGVGLAFDRSNLRVDGQIEAGSVRKAAVDVQLGSLVARQAAQVRAQLAGFHLRAQFRPGPEDGAWRVDVEQLALTGLRGAWTAGTASLVRGADASLQLEAGLLRLDDLAPWLSLARSLPSAAARLRDLQGDIEAVKLSVLPPSREAPGSSPPAFTVNARLHGVGLAATGEQPGLSGLEGQLDGGSDGGHIVLDGSPLRLQLPSVFEQDLPIESLRGELAWARVGEDWRLSAPSLDLQMLGTHVDGDAAFRLPTGEPDALPLLDLRLHLRSADIAVLKPLMPKTWGPNTRAWLAHALTHARVTRGDLKIDAAMTPRAADGHMTMPWKLDLDIAGGELDYAEGWPAASALNAQLHFHDGGLDLAADSGEVSGSEISGMTATIANFQDADLVLDGNLSGDGADFYRLLRNSPLQSRVGSLLRVTEASGPVSATVHLDVPLNIPNPPVLASGEVRFNDAELAIRGVEQPLRSVRGGLRFGGSGITADQLTAQLYGTPVIARITPEPGVPDGVLVGEFAFAPAAQGGPEEVFVPSWLRSGLSGRTTMQLRLPFSGPDSGKLSLSSDLRGVTSQLPPPLAKLPDDSLALKVGITGDTTVPLRLEIQAADALSAGLRFAEVGGELVTRGVELRIGSGAVPSAAADGFSVVGAPAVLDLRSWAALLGAAQSGSGNLPFTRADLNPEKLVYGRYALGRTQLLAVPTANGAFRVDLDGAAKGQIDWQTDHGGRVTGRLQSFALDSLPPLPAAPAAPEKASPFDPNTAPLLDLECEHLSLGKVDFGHLGIVTERVADGQHIQRLQLAGGKLVVDAHGSWLRHSGAGVSGSSAELAFDVGSSAIGEVLSVFGYAPNLVARDAQFDGRLSWPTVPDGLELAQAEGKVTLNIKRGTLKAIEPGAGRVLGLINLYALPRRLLFDFRDVVSDGLAFDTITGGFKLAGGDADTSDVQISGPQAKIRLEGRIGLAARDYDQRVIVTPDISTGVTLGATLLGGPIGGGIALVAQQLFGKPFNRLARFSYRLTGSWDNPEVIKGPAEAAPAPKPEPNGVNNG